MMSEQSYKIFKKCKICGKENVTIMSDGRLKTHRIPLEKRYNAEDYERCFGV